MYGHCRWLYSNSPYSYMVTSYFLHFEIKNFLSSYKAKMTTMIPRHTSTIYNKKWLMAIKRSSKLFKKGILYNTQHIDLNSQHSPDRINMIKSRTCETFNSAINSCKYLLKERISWSILCIPIFSSIGNIGHDPSMLEMARLTVYLSKTGPINIGYYLLLFSSSFFEMEDATNSKTQGLNHQLERV